MHVRLRPIQKYHPAATFILIIDDDISKYQQLEKANKRSIYKKSMVLKIIHRVYLVNCMNENPI